MLACYVYNVGLRPRKEDQKNILSLSMEWRYRPYTLYVYAYFLMLVNYIQTAIWTITLPVVTRNVNTGTTEYKHWIRGRALEVQYYIISFKVWIMECTPNSTTYTFHTICASVIRNTGSFRGIASCTIDITSWRSQSYTMSNIGLGYRYGKIGDVMA